MPKSAETEDLKLFGENLRRIRKERDITMQQLANLAEIELSQIYRIESGKINPKLTTILKILKSLNISAEELFRGY